MNCLFCGKLKTWRSSIEIRDEETKSTLGKVTVCPECRIKNTIQDVYMKLVEDAAKKNLEVNRE